MTLDPIQALILGIVQGLTEFLPISSSAHLVIIPWLLGWNGQAVNSLSFDVALHMGTLIAVLAYFWQDWWNMIRGGLTWATSRRDPDGQARMLAYILVGTIPGVIAGLALESRIDDWFHSPDVNQRATGIVIISCMMIALALVLFAAERLARHLRQMKDMDWRTALGVGFAQALAVIPGVSRSGSTITAGLFANLTRETAARFSFLLGTPIILGSGVKKAYDAVKAGGIPSGEQVGFVLGFVAALVVGYLTIAVLLRYLQRNSTMPFVVYRLIVGVLLILLVLFGFRG